MRSVTAKNIMAKDLFAAWLDVKDTVIADKIEIACEARMKNIYIKKGA